MGSPPASPPQGPKPPLLRLLSLATTHAGRLGALLALVGYLGLLALPLFERRVKFDEKTLMLGNARLNIGWVRACKHGAEDRWVPIQPGVLPDCLSAPSHPLFATCAGPGMIPRGAPRAAAWAGPAMRLPRALKHWWSACTSTCTRPLLTKQAASAAAAAAAVPVRARLPSGRPC